MSWLVSNFGTVIAGLFLIAVISAIIIVLIKNKRKGKSSCGCNCAHCAMSDSCHKQK